MLLWYYINGLIGTNGPMNNKRSLGRTAAVRLCVTQARGGARGDADAFMGGAPQLDGLPMRCREIAAGKGDCMKRKWISILLCLMLLCSFSACGSAVAWEYRPITDVNDLQGRRVGVNLAWEPDYLLSGRSDLELVRYDSVADMILALKFNKVDALAVDDMIWKVMSVGSLGLRRVDPAFASVGYTIYFSPDGEALRDDFDAFLAEYQQSEEYRDHIARLEAFDGKSYVGPDIPQTRTGELLRVAIEAEGFPRSFPDPVTDQPSGFDLEALRYFANARNYRLEISLSNYVDIVYGLQAGVYDVGVGNLSDVYAQEVIDAGMYPSAAMDYSGLYFIEKTQPSIRVNTDVLD